VPIALAAAAAVWLPARAVGGPEALAAFYLLMFSLGPLVYFGLHWFIGRRARPALSAAESAAIGGSGLLLVILPALLASMALPWVHQLEQGARQAQRGLAVEAPLAHRILQLGEPVEDLVGQPAQGRILIERRDVRHRQAMPICQCLLQRRAVAITFPTCGGQARRLNNGRHVRTTSTA